jgi:hypothetical protein
MKVKYCWTMLNHVEQTNKQTGLNKKDVGWSNLETCSYCLVAWYRYNVKNHTILWSLTMANMVICFQCAGMVLQSSRPPFWFLNFRLYNIMYIYIYCIHDFTTFSEYLWGQWGPGNSTLAMCISEQQRKQHIFVQSCFPFTEQHWSVNLSFVLKVKWHNTWNFILSIPTDTHQIREASPATAFRS